MTNALPGSPLIQPTPRWLPSFRFYASLSVLMVALAALTGGSVPTLSAAPPQALGDPISGEDFALAALNADPTGITWDGIHFLVVDSSDDKVYAYNFSGVNVPGEDFALAALNADPTGITSDGIHRWVVDSSDDKVYAYNFSGVNVPGEDFALAALNADPTGITWDGIHFLVVDSSDDKVYAYNFSGVNVPGEDFALAALNADPTGITWDGIHRWVVNQSADMSLRVAYAYDVDGVPVGGRDFRVLESTSGHKVDGIAWYGRTFDLRVLSGTLDDVLAYAGYGPPVPPARITVQRNAALDEVVMGWEISAPVSEYDIERLEATVVGVGPSERIEYGNPARITVDGTIAGVDSYTDTDVDPLRTYQYRIRARGGVDEWSAWSAYIFSGGKERIGIRSPGNVEVLRSDDNQSVTVSWTAPEETVDSYTVQRQELAAELGSSFFANTKTVADDADLDADTLTWTDDTVFGGTTYEYRVAGVKDGVVGEYTEWFRSTPVITEFGEAPADLRITADTRLDDRREVWLGWEKVDGADDYELQVRVADPATGLQTLLDPEVVTGAEYFYTAFARAELRVRGRVLDAGMCGSAEDDRCATDWTGWFGVGFAAPVRQAPRPDTLMTPPPTEQAVMDMRNDFESVVDVGTESTGLDVPAGQVLNIGVLASGTLLAGLAFWVARRRGLGTWGTGTALTFFVLWLWQGHHLAGVPDVWPIMGTVAVNGAGVVSGAKVAGLFGRPA